MLMFIAKIEAQIMVFFTCKVACLFINHIFIAQIHLEEGSIVFSQLATEVRNCNRTV